MRNNGEGVTGSCGLGDGGPAELLVFEGGRGSQVVPLLLGEGVDLLFSASLLVLLLVFAGVIVIGIVISGVSALLAVMRYLRLKTSDLYF